MSKSVQIAEAIEGITQARATAQEAWKAATDKGARRILRGAVSSLMQATDALVEAHAEALAAESKKEKEELENPSLPGM